MSQRKEYNDRWNAPLVNPAITEGEYQAQKQAKELAELDESNWAKYFEEIKARSEYVEAE